MIRLHSIRSACKEFQTDALTRISLHFQLRISRAYLSLCIRLATSTRPARKAHDINHVTFMGWALLRLPHIPNDCNFLLNSACMLLMTSTAVACCNGAKDSRPFERVHWRCFGHPMDCCHRRNVVAHLNEPFSPEDARLETEVSPEAGCLDLQRTN